MKVFVALAFLALATGTQLRGNENDGPCCNTCTVSGEEKYYSIDKTHNMCGEACMKPSQYSLYKIFESGLTKATDNSPCADAKYHTYDSTVTHGMGPVKMTLDLYKPDALEHQDNIKEALEAVTEDPTKCIMTHCMSQAVACKADAACNTFTACAKDCTEGSCFAKCMGDHPDAATVNIIACARTNKCGVPSPQAELTLADDPQVTVYKVDYPDKGQGECGEMDMAASAAKWPISMGGFKKGNCAKDAGYTVADGQKKECYGQYCSMVRIFKKAAVEAMSLGEAPTWTDCKSGGEVMTLESATVNAVHPGKPCTFTWTGTLASDLSAASTHFSVYAKKMGKWVSVPWSTDLDLSKFSTFPAKAGENTLHVDMTLPGMVPEGRFRSQLLTTSGSTKVSCVMIEYDITKA